MADLQNIREEIDIVDNKLLAFRAQDGAFS